MAKHNRLPWWAWVPFLPVLLSLLLLWRRRRSKARPRANVHRDSIPLPPESPFRPSMRGDDLVAIKGLSLKAAAVLQADGIFSYAQLAQTPVDLLQEILLAAGLRQVDPKTWPEQAAELLG